ncbi:MAG: family 1 glycosylhydrolase, partial [Desulfomonilia bacterium]
MGTERTQFSTLETDLSRSAITVPEEFLFGVANSGYQVEGGYNQPGCPYNNFARWELSGRVERTGDACNFWSRYQDHIDLASSLGLNAFRMGIEWARVQPSFHERVSTPPPFDELALDGYTAILDRITGSGMTPIVTLHHFTHPAWCGVDLWLQEGMACLFIEYAVEVVRRINERLVLRGRAPLVHLVTLNEPNVLPLVTYMVGEHPHGRWGFAAARTAMDTMLLAHVLLYDRIHDLYEQQGWPRPIVTFNTFSTAIYEFDRAFFDLVRAPSSGVDRRSLKDYLAMHRRNWNQKFDELSLSRWGRFSYSRRHFKNYRFVCSLLFDPLNMKRTIEALYASSRKEKLDAIALDIYDPFVIGAPYFRVPRPGTHDPIFRPQWWDWHHDPEHFSTVLRAHNDSNFGLPLYILETTLAHRQKYRGSAIPRRDSQGRGEFLRWSIQEVLKAIHENIPVMAYCYWSLTDNYEWGTFEPRLGLYEYDYEIGRIKDRSGLGEDAGGLYKNIVTSLRKRDPDWIRTYLAQ